ncbi:hypothetical protein C7S14_0164 [Burkholderia cepacia]|nr:hypothetical protein C7S14_0164 [Burkholderia cepacia]
MTLRGPRFVYVRRPADLRRVSVSPLRADDRKTCRRLAGPRENATCRRAARQSSGFNREVFVTFR